MGVTRGQTYAFGGVIPVVHPTAFVHPTAVLIGDVVIGAGCYVGPHASLRGDLGRVQIGGGANIQDGCVLHTFAGQVTEVGQDGHIGHGAVLHGCHVGAGALVGIRAVVLDGARIGERAFVGAQSLVPADAEVPAGNLAVGIPVRIVRELSPTDLEWKATGTRLYQELARACIAGLHAEEPLPAEEQDRPALPLAGGDSAPLRLYRSQKAAPEGFPRPPAR